MKKLKSLLLEYEDGSTKHVDANDLDSNVHSSLATSGLCSPPAQISAARHFLILEWKDGWKEVVAIHNDVASLIRYYVIRRIEERGRLAIDVGGVYPQLRIIERLPMDISRLLIISDSGVKSYGLQSIIESYEGIFEDGGKKEYKKFDRENPSFQNEFNEGPETIAEIKNSVAAAIGKKGVSAPDLLRLDPEERVREYQEIAKIVGITGMERQSDVCGLIEIMLRKL
jgi:hypothetical protein